MKNLLILFLLACSCADVKVDEAEAGVARPQEEAFTVCDPMLRYHLWLAATAKVPPEDCFEGFHFRSDGSTSPAVFCVQITNDQWIYRYYGIQRPGRHLAHELSFDNYACEFQECDIYTASMVCNCSYCTTLGFDPAPL